jgi:hypothetical protein
VGKISKSHSISVKNSGTSSAIIGKAAVALPFHIGSDGCSGKTIAKGKSCSIGTTFAPTAAGSFSSTLSIPYNGTTPASVSLIGAGVAALHARPN